jgi:O-antigen/teichoic acid export membrane protein
LTKIITGSFFNLLGMIIPSIIAIPAIAVISRNLDRDEFGFFLLALTVTSLAGAFDFGLAKSMTRHLAKSESNEDDYQIMGTSVRIGVALYISITICVYLCAEKIAELLKLGDFDSEARLVYVNQIESVAIIVGANLLGVHLLGYFEGKTRFRDYNVIKITGGVAVVGIPALLSGIRESLEDAIFGMILARVLTLIITLGYINKLVGLSWTIKWSRTIFCRMVKEDYGLVGVNFLAPIIMQVDRIIVSSTLGVGKLAFYAAPADLISRVSIGPAAIARTLFPLVSSNGKYVENAILDGKAMITWCNIVMLLPIFALAEPILRVWLGVELASTSASILQIFVIGLFFNNLTQIPATNLLARGRSNLLFIIYLAEIPIYIIGIYMATETFGMIGAASIWALRNAVDYLVIAFIEKYHTRTI